MNPASKLGSSAKRIWLLWLDKECTNSVVQLWRTARSKSSLYTRISRNNHRSLTQSFFSKLPEFNFAKILDLQLHTIFSQVVCILRITGPDRILLEIENISLLPWK